MKEIHSTMGDEYNNREKNNTSTKTLTVYRHIYTYSTHEFIRSDLTQNNSDGV